MTVALRSDPAPVEVPRWHRHRWGAAAVRQRDGVWCHGKTGELSRGRITVQLRRCARCAAVEVVESWPRGRRRSIAR